MRAHKLDMLHGPIWSKLPRFALPVAATAILEQLFNALDIAVVGNFTGAEKTAAVAAVGANSPIIGLIVNLFIGVALGTNVVIAHAVGEGDKRWSPSGGENGSFSYTPDAPPEEGGPAKAEEPPPQPPQESAPETGPTFSRCITVFFENGSAAIISGTDGSDEGEILAAAQAAVEKEAGFGYLGDCDLFYLSAGKKDSAKVSLFPARYLRASLLQTSLYLLCAFALTMLACYGISRYISRLAVRPVEQAMNREKQFVADISHDLNPPWP